MATAHILHTPTPAAPSSAHTPATDTQHQANLTAPPHPTAPRTACTCHDPHTGNAKRAISPPHTRPRAGSAERARARSREVDGGEGRGASGQERPNHGRVVRPELSAPQLQPFHAAGQQRRRPRPTVRCAQGHRRRPGRPAQPLKGGPPVRRCDPSVPAVPPPDNAQRQAPVPGRPGASTGRNPSVRAPNVGADTARPRPLP